MALVELGRFGFPEGELVAGRLRAAGIEAVTFDTGTHLVEGAFRMIPIRVMVDEDDLDEARAILAEPPPAA
ncbi:MAG: putative signal transducing protein [Sphingomonas sp.]